MDRFRKYIYSLIVIFFIFNLYSVFQYVNYQHVTHPQASILSISAENLSQYFFLKLHLRDLNERANENQLQIRHVHRKPVSPASAIHPNPTKHHVQSIRKIGGCISLSSNTSKPKYESNFVEQDPETFFVTNERIPTECLIRYPRNDQLKVHNIYWQEFKAKKWRMAIYSGFYDDRIKYGLKSPFVRILGISNSNSIKNDTMYCQLWFTEFHKARVSQVTKVEPLWPWKKNSAGGTVEALGYMISCPLKGGLKNLIPFAVSLVIKRCDLATNKVKVTYNQQNVSSGIGVCVKGVDFPHKDISLRLLEWIVLVRVLGARKIHLYLYSVHPNTQKVLDYYEKKGFLEVRPLTLPGKLPNEPLGRHKYLYGNIKLKQRLEILPYNDCLYRNMYRYEYIALLDVDEVIIPLKFKTWKELLESEAKSDAAARNTTRGRGKKPKLETSSYQVKQGGCFFEGIKRPPFSEIPKTMHMLQHIYKIPPLKRFVVGMKGFFVPRRVLIGFNHQPSHCQPYPCRLVNVNETVAQLQHYKNIKRHCSGLPKSSKCNNFDCLNSTMTDKTLWKYKGVLIPRFNKSLSCIFKDRQPPMEWKE